jgi:hypothetical protein
MGYRKGDVKRMTGDRGQGNSGQRTREQWTEDMETVDRGHENSG